MPRDAGGNYTLPAGNPVITGTVITSTWANPTMSDIGNEISNSLSRDGQGGMRVPLQFFDGTTNNPGMTFTLEPTAGIFRVTSGVVGISAQGTAIALFKGQTGNVQTDAAAPIEDHDLTQKIWVEELIATALAAQGEIDWPVGARFIGPDPNGVKAGTWAQMPEGTFLMNTIAGADPAGGSNDAAVIEHAHPASQPAHGHVVNDGGHSHTSPSAQDNTNDGNTTGHNSRSPTGTVSTNSQVTGITLNNATPSVTVDPAGVSGVGLNRPQYVGVEVWERTA